MRHIGVSAYGIRLPIITRGDSLPGIAADSLCAAIANDGISLSATDIVGVTESIVAKAQGNYADIKDIAEDIRNKFKDTPVGVVFPILSRNRFLNILKGIAMGARKVYVLLQAPQDEVGNPVMEIETLDGFGDIGLMPASEFKARAGVYTHPFTGVDYIGLYEGVGDNVEIYISQDPRDILKLTSHALVCETHTRERTKARLLRAGAEAVYTLADILSAPVTGGYNPDYGVLGSNLSTGTELKLFPRDCDAFVESLRREIASRTGVAPEVLVYGDGAFKDPAAGIWELADPVVAPGYTERLGERPSEIKLKLVADEVFGDMAPGEKREAITRLISQKKANERYREGTTPRKYADLVGSLCDLMSGSGDKGTPMVLIKGYFDDYASE